MILSYPIIKENKYYYMEIEKDGKVYFEATGELSFKVEESVLSMIEDFGLARKLREEWNSSHNIEKAKHI